MTTLPIRTWLAAALVVLVVVPQLAIGAALDLEQWLVSPANHPEIIRNIKENAARWSDPAWQAELTTRLSSSHLNAILQDSAGHVVFQSASFPMLAGLKADLAIPSKPLIGTLIVTSGTARTADGNLQRSQAVSPGTKIQVVAVPIALFDGLAGNFERDVFYRLIPGPTTRDDGQNTVVYSISTQEVTDSRGQVSHLTVWGQEDPALVRLRNMIAPVTGVGALLLTLMVLAWLIGRSILRPLAAMSQAARLIAAGDLAFQLPDSHVREVAEVGAAFRVMGEALGESIQRQAQLEQERRLLISAIVHDLRTPLFSLRGYLAGLAEGVANTPEKSERYIAVCQDKVAALDRLVSDLFAYAQIEYLEQEPVRDVLDMGELLTRTVEEVQPLARAKDIKLFVSGPTERGLVDGDEHLLTRAIENLLDNALRHTPPEGSVEVSWRRLGPHLEFRVGDSGPGFAPGDLPHVFAPLYRAETSRNRRTGGAGLGLTIARRIMLAHGGDLTAANDPSGGAVLTGALPASRAACDRPRPDDLPPTECPLVANGVVTSTGSPLRSTRRDA